MYTTKATHSAQGNVEKLLKENDNQCAELTSGQQIQLDFAYHLSSDNVTILQTILGDVNGDRKVDVKDVYAVAKAYGSSLEGPDLLDIHGIPYATSTMTARST